MTSRISYQPALTGLRGAAIIFVLIKHADISAIPGADEGVTVFFVLSGYLITSILLAEFNTSGTIRLSDFYRRRFARLTPVFVVWWSTTIAFLLVTGKTLGAFWVGAVTTATYSINELLGLGIISQGNNLSAVYFAHAWSLAIEEQFYLLWPGLLILALRRKRGNPVRLAAAIAGTVALTVVVWRYLVWFNGGGRARIFFSTDTRLDSIMLGCMLALLLRNPAVERFVRRYAVALAGVGVSLLCVSMLWLANAFDPWSNTTATLASGLILCGLVGAPERGLARVLNTRWLTHTGTLSYSLYLWNPLVLEIFLRLFSVRSADSPLGLVWIGGSFVVAQMSYLYVERPARRWLSKSKAPALDRESTNEPARTLHGLEGIESPATASLSSPVSRSANVVASTVAAGATGPT
jgi:peptidoglycan/LPS O-acetylase OafA/YrhL